MKLSLEQLEARDVPAPLIPGWDGPEQQVRFLAGGSSYLAVVAEAGGSARLLVFGPQVILDEIVFDPSFRGGGRLAVVHGQPADSLLLVPGPGGGPVVAQFDFDTSGRLALSASYFAPYALDFRGGLTVSSGDVNGDGRADAMFLPGEGGGPQLTAIDLRTHETILSMWVGVPDDLSGAARFEPTGGTVMTSAGLGLVIQYGPTVDYYATTQIWKGTS